EAGTHVEGVAFGLPPVRPASHLPALFEQGDVETAALQAHGRRQASESAAYDYGLGRFPGIQDIHVTVFLPRFFRRSAPWRARFLFRIRPPSRRLRRASCPYSARNGGGTPTRSARRWPGSTACRRPTIASPREVPGKLRRPAAGSPSINPRAAASR